MIVINDNYQTVSFKRNEIPTDGVLFIEDGVLEVGVSADHLHGGAQAHDARPNNDDIILGYAISSTKQTCLLSCRMSTRSLSSQM